MQLVQSISNIDQNMNTLDEYLQKKTDPEYSFAVDLIKRGTCFLALETEEGVRFYPSRFMGYKENTMENHLNNTEKSGIVTNNQISMLYGGRFETCNDLDKLYCEYCETLGFVAREKGSFGVERKFMELIFEGEHVNMKWPIKDIHVDILEVLLNVLMEQKEKALITYGDLCERIGSTISPRNIAGYLGDLSVWAREMGAPMISALVVNQKEFMPGSGFFGLYEEEYGKKVVDKERIFREELQKVRTYKDWDDFGRQFGLIAA